jgi:hypothetical protein
MDIKYADSTGFFKVKEISCFYVLQNLPVPIRRNFQRKGKKAKEKDEKERRQGKKETEKNRIGRKARKKMRGILNALTRIC